MGIASAAHVCFLRPSGGGGRSLFTGEMRRKRGECSPVSRKDMYCAANTRLGLNLALAFETWSQFMQCQSVSTLLLREEHGLYEGNTTDT